MSFRTRGSSKTVYDFVESVLLIGILFCLFFILRESFCLTIYQVRDIERAQLVSHGSLALFGSEMSGGGHLPGGFYYCLMALVWSLFENIESLFLFMVMLMCCGAAIVWKHLDRILNIESATLFIVLLLCNPVFLQISLNFQNPSFLTLFALVAMLLLSEIFAANTDVKRSKTLWFLFCIVLALGLQLHFSMIYFLVAALFIQFCSPWLRFQAVDRRSIRLGLLLIAALLAPHLVWLWASRLGLQVGMAVAGAPGSPFQAMPFLHEQTYQVPWFSRIPVIRFLLSRALALHQLWPIYFGGLMLAFWPGRESLKKSRLRSLFILSLLVSVLSLSVFTYLHFDLDFTRYLFLFALGFAVWASLWLTAQFGRTPHVGGLNLALVVSLFVTIWRPLGEPMNWGRACSYYSVETLGVLLACLLGFFALNVIRNQGSLRLAGARFLYLALAVIAIMRAVVEARIFTDVERKALNWREAKAMASHITAMSGATPSEFRDHLYFVDIPESQSMRFVPVPVPMTAKLTSQESRRPQAQIDGLFVGLEKEEKPLGEPGHEDDWLATREIESSVLSMIRSQKIVLGSIVHDGRLVLIPYQFADHQTRVGLPVDFLQNRGRPYEPVVPTRLGDQYETVGEAEFALCNGSVTNCEIRVTVQALKKAPNALKSELHVSITGLTISQPTDWTVPNWTDSLVNLRLRIRCDETTHMIVVADRLGFFYGQHYSTNGFLLAPFRRHFDDPCLRHQYQSIEVVYDEDQVHSRGGSARLPGQSFLLKAHQK